MKIVKVPIGLQNDERNIQELINDNIYHALEEVRKIDSTLELQFSEKTYYRCQFPRKFVRQYSKKKYGYDVMKVIRPLLEFEKDKSWKISQVIDLPDKWLIFCKS